MLATLTQEHHRRLQDVRTARIEADSMRFHTESAWPLLQVKNPSIFPASGVLYPFYDQFIAIEKISNSEDSPIDLICTPSRVPHNPQLPPCTTPPKNRSEHLKTLKSPWADNYTHQTTNQRQPDVIHHLSFNFISCHLCAS